jgi:hypothetical protein
MDNLNFTNYRGKKDSNSLVFTDSQGNRFYYSYKTLVAFFNVRTGLVCLKNYWSVTTGKHLNAIEPDKKRRVNDVAFKMLLKSIKYDTKDTYTGHCYNCDCLISADESYVKYLPQYEIYLCPDCYENNKQKLASK